MNKSLKKFIILLLSRKTGGRKVREAQNVVASMGRAKRLYKQLIAKTHPDRNPGKEERAKELSAQLNAYRYNLQELERLKTVVEQELLV